MVGAARPDGFLFTRTQDWRVQVLSPAKAHDREFDLLVGALGLLRRGSDPSEDAARVP